MKRRRILSALAASALCSIYAISTQAAFDSEIEKAYNTAVQGQDALDGLDVRVLESTVSSKTNIASEKEVSLQVSGIKNTSLSVDMNVSTQEGEAETYYRNGYYYETGTDGKIKRRMDREEIWTNINAQIYLDMTSNYLDMLYSSSDDDGNTVYHFAASGDKLGDYSSKILDTYSDAGVAEVSFVSGTMTVDRDGHVVDRSIQAVYSVGEGDDRETFMKKADAEFSQNGEVTVSLPDLSSYQDVTAKEEPSVTLTIESKTLYTTADINVRGAGSLDGAVIGGYPRGSAVTQTGYTSDGWIQIIYNGVTGYIWGDYTSQTKPVTTKNTTGTMYTTTVLNVRENPSTDGALLGVLSSGSSVEVTGTTDNGWTRIRYKGALGYVYSSYLSASEPASPAQTQSATISGMVTDASYGSLTLKTANGIMMFNTTYAQMNLKDTIYSGDTVTVVYTGSGIPYTASVVTDTVSHNQGTYTAVQKQYYYCEGVITRVSGSNLEMTCSDGVYRTFDISGAAMEGGSKLSAGMYVSVSWMSVTGNERTNIPAVAIS